MHQEAEIVQAGQAHLQATLFALVVVPVPLRPSGVPVLSRSNSLLAKLSVLPPRPSLVLTPMLLLLLLAAPVTAPLMVSLLELPRFR